MKYVLAFLLAFAPLQAFAAKADTKIDLVAIDFQDANSDPLIDRFPYLDKDENIKTATFHSKTMARDYFLIQETGNSLCNDESCPIKVFDIMNPRIPKMIIELIAPLVVKARDCPDQLSFLFVNKDKSVTAWIPGNQKFKPSITYPNIDAAKICEKPEY